MFLHPRGFIQQGAQIENMGAPHTNSPADKSPNRPIVFVNNASTLFLRYTWFLSTTRIRVYTCIIITWLGIGYCSFACVGQKEKERWWWKLLLFTYGVFRASQDQWGIEAHRVENAVGRWVIAAPRKLRPVARNFLPQGAEGSRAFHSTKSDQPIRFVLVICCTLTSTNNVHPATGA